MGGEFNFFFIFYILGAFLMKQYSTVNRGGMMETDWQQLKRQSRDREV